MGSDLGRRTFVPSCPESIYVKEEGSGGGKRGGAKKKAPKQLSEAFKTKMTEWAARTMQRSQPGQRGVTNVLGPAGCDAP